MKKLPWGPEWTKRSVHMPDDAIPWNKGTRRAGVTQNQESVSMLHDRVPDGVNGLRISHIWGTQDNSANQRHTLRMILRFGDMQFAAAGVGGGIPGIFTADIAILGGAPFFPVYWVIPSGVDFDVTFLQNFVALPTMFGYLSGWYF